jgi:hypothetical protein
MISSCKNRQGDSTFMSSPAYAAESGTRYCSLSNTKTLNAKSAKLFANAKSKSLTHVYVNVPDRSTSDETLSEIKLYAGNVQNPVMTFDMSLDLYTRSGKLARVSGAIAKENYEPVFKITVFSSFVEMTEYTADGDEISTRADIACNAG